MPAPTTLEADKKPSVPDTISSASNSSEEAAAAAPGLQAGELETDKQSSIPDTMSSVSDSSEEDDSENTKINIYALPIVFNTSDNNITGLIAKKLGELDAVIHLGDYIYEYPRDGYASQDAAALNRFMPPIACSETTRIPEMMRLFAFCSRVNGLFLEALAGITTRGCVCCMP